jgi:hypothetical protein
MRGQNEDCRDYTFVRKRPPNCTEGAIAIGKGAEVPLKIEAKVDKVNQQYFKDEIETLPDPYLMEFIGEIGESERDEFLGRACRDSFDKRFGVHRTARDDVALYERLLSDGERDDGGKLRLIRPRA